MTGRLALGPGLARGPAVTIVVDGRSVTAYTGETVAAALMAEGIVAIRRTPGGEPRGVFCGMGVCFDCLAVIDGVPNTRTCMTWVREGMDVRLQDGWSYHGA
ncbi:MAG TPA: (2Fe-2S)-binding protein [Solirubrobacter sp.]|nr:(2Fe-2S)-binding protein [Solirubrobacter sp.]